MAMSAPPGTIHGTKRNDVGRVGVIDHAASAVGLGNANGMVHEMAGEFAGGLTAVFQTPNNAPRIARFVDFNDAAGVLGLKRCVAHELAGTRGDEEFAGKVGAGNAHVHPRAGLVEFRCAFGHFFSGHAIRKVAAVAFVPALKPAVVAQAGEPLHACSFDDAHVVLPSFITQGAQSAPCG